MANSPILHQSYDHPPLSARAFTNQEMNSDVVKLKKRKFFNEQSEESSLPAAKHKCCNSENVSCDAYHAQVDSAEDSSSFTSNSQLSVKFDTNSENIDSYDEASTSWSNSASVKSRKSSFYSESEILSGMGEGKEAAMLMGSEKYPHLNVGWDDNDFLEECISAEHCMDVKQQKSEGLEEFLSCSGMNPSIFALSSESWSVDQEAQPGRWKPTIDQEFEQYFSMLML